VTHAHAVGLGLLILAIVLLAGLTPVLPRTAGRVAALVLTGLGVAWLLVNGPMEGATLLIIEPGHGITVADILSVGAFAVAGSTLVRSRR